MQLIAIRATVGECPRVASESLNRGATSEPTFDQTPAAVLDRKTLLAKFDGIRQFARGGRRAPNKPLLLLMLSLASSTTAKP